MRGALWALGTLVLVGGVGYGVLSIFAGAMSDNPYAGEDTARDGLWIAGSALLIGGGMIGAGFKF